MLGFLSAQLFSWLSLLIAVDSQCTSCTECINQATAAEYGDMQTCLYGSSVSNSTCVPMEEVLTLLTMMNNSLPTSWYLGGWYSDPNGDVYQTQLKALKAGQDRNVVYGNWSNIVRREYTFAARSVPGAGLFFARAISVLRAAGWNTTGLDLIGHSLGAHAWGWVGKCQRWKPPRITGLDPAGPLFTEENGLNRTDANFVEVIHTNDCVFGTSNQIGDVDFYPNGGCIQPGCTILDSPLCSHNRSVLFFAESVNNKTGFVARSCDSYYNFENGLCSSNATTIMGDATPSDVSGRYYLNTAAEPPFALGESGAG